MGPSSYKYIIKTINGLSNYSEESIVVHTHRRQARQRDGDFVDDVKIDRYVFGFVCHRVYILM